MSKTKQILSLLKSGKSVKEIVKIAKVKPSYVYTVRWTSKKKADKKPEKKAQFKSPRSRLIKDLFEMKSALDVIESKKDVVNHPPHYKTGGVETLDFIEAKDLNYRLGNVIKYVSRAGKKDGSDPVQDLEKAAFYLNREIAARKSA
jgi:hypothetical protein